MATPTSRTKEPAVVSIDYDKCDGCGECVKACSDFSFEIIDKKVTLTDHSVFGCVGCGHCMMACHNGVIAVEGRTLTPVKMFDLPDKKEVPTFASLMAMLQRRRSVRQFKEKPVEAEKINLILEAAQTAPMGLPPSDVHVVVFENKNQVRAFAEDFSHFLKGLRWMASDWFMTLMRPFWGKATDEMMRGFIKPVFDVYINEMDEGKNWINYDAPLAMYFYGSPYTDPADPIIAAMLCLPAKASDLELVYLVLCIRLFKMEKKPAYSEKNGV